MMIDGILVVYLFQFILVYHKFGVCNGKISNCSTEMFPSAVAIVNTENRILSCSGAIVSKNVIASTRLCKQLNEKLEDLVAIIEKDQLQDKNLKGDQVMKILHVQCSDNDHDDICLFKVNGEFEEKNIAIVEKKRPSIGEKLHLVGWRIATNDQMANNIRKEEFTVTRCLEKATKSDFCADPGSDSSNNCPGDVGGPIYKGKKLRGFFVSGFCRSPGKYIRATDILHVDKSLHKYAANTRSCAQKRINAKLTQFVLTFLAAALSLNLNGSLISFFLVA